MLREQMFKDTREGGKWSLAFFVVILKRS